MVPKKDRASGGAAIGVAITISGQVASGYLSGFDFHPNQLELSLRHHFKLVAEPTAHRFHGLTDHWYLFCLSRGSKPSYWTLTADSFVESVSW